MNLRILLGEALLPPVHAVGSDELWLQELAADLQRIQQIDDADKRHSTEGRRRIGELWYRWLDDERTKNVRLTDLAPLLKRDRSYLKKCQNLWEFERSGLRMKMQEAMPDFDAGRMEPYATARLHAEYVRRFQRKESSESATEASESATNARGVRDPWPIESIPRQPVTEFLTGDVFEKITQLRDEWYDIIVTSPGYWGHRDYFRGQPEYAELAKKQIGLEPTYTAYMATITSVCDAARRVLKPNGTLFLIMGDKYSHGGQLKRTEPRFYTRNWATPEERPPVDDVPEGSPMMLPERVAMALQDDGWHLRSIVTWDKGGSGGPESVKNRPVVSDEKILIFGKKRKYHWNEEASLTPCLSAPRLHRRQEERDDDLRWRVKMIPYRTVIRFSAARKNSSSNHPARFPEALVRWVLRCACPPNGKVLDCFGGSGTSAVVANQMGFDCTLIELHPEFMKEAERNVAAVAKPTPRLKPFSRDKNAIIHGDALQELRKLKTESVGMILADFPYGNNKTGFDWDQNFDFESILEECWRVLKIDGSLVLNADDLLKVQLISLYPSLHRTTWKWFKPRHANIMSGRSQPRRHIEYVVVFNRVARVFNPQTTTIEQPIGRFYKRLPRKFLGKMITFDEFEQWVTKEMPIDLLYFEFQAGEKIKFPTQKPIALGEYMIRSYAHPNDTVLDLTTGSGSYLISSFRTGHTFLGIEKDPKHFEIACRRVAAEMDTKLILPSAHA